MQSSSADSVASAASAGPDLLRPLLMIAASIALALLSISLFLLERIEFVSGYADLKRGLRGGKK